jgi:HD-like signal output (HDOD) protein
MATSEEIVAKCAAIPPFPQVATQVLAVMKDVNAPLDRVIGLVEKDIALTAAVLKVANSGLYGRSGKVSSCPFGKAA